MAKSNFWFSNKGIAALLLIGTVIYFLVIEHGVHLFPYLPFLILLLCPLMHVFMHGGHGNHDNHDEHESHHSDDLEKAYRKGLEEGRRKRD